MKWRAYLPSVRFVVMVGSLALSAGLVLAAQYATKPHNVTLSASSNQAAVAQQPYDWQQALQEVVSQSGIQVPQAPDSNTVNSLLAQSQTTNLTTAVGRSLLINLSSASAQGLGQDDPTQNQLIAQAAAQINASATSTAYGPKDLAVVPTSKDALRAYGNDVMAAFASQPKANAQQTYIYIGEAVDAQDATALGALDPIAGAYGRLAQSLLSTPVPQTLAPLHLELVNDLTAMAAAYPEMKQIITDPLRGAAAVQRYASALDEASRVLTSMAQTLKTDGILFTKDEPGQSWSAFLSQ